MSLDQVLFRRSELPRPGAGAAEVQAKLARGTFADLVGDSELIVRAKPKKVELDGKPYGEFPVVALEEVPIAGILGRGWDSLRLFFK